MSIWTKIIWPFFSKVLKYMLSLFERTAAELAKKIPEVIIEPIRLKIIDLSDNTSLSGIEKMKVVKDFALNLLGEQVKTIGNSAIDTLLQVMYQDLKNNGMVK